MRNTTMTMKNKIQGEYFTFLKERIRAHYDEYNNYNYVLRIMHMIPMLVLVKMDENIVEWGLENRRKFQYAYPQYSDDDIVEALPPQCSLLEAGIYLAEQTDDSIIRKHRTFYDGTHEIFWEMVLDNIGLREYTDEQAMASRRSIDQIEVILRHLNERDYEPDGRGNWFWLKEPRAGIDLRKIPLVEQMWAYVNEGQSYRWD